MSTQKTLITFYPVGNGDCNLIEFSDGVKMMIDCNFRTDAEDENTDSFDVFNDLLSKLTIKKGLSYLNAFVLSQIGRAHV